MFLLYFNLDIFFCNSLFLSVAYNELWFASLTLSSFTKTLVKASLCVMWFFFLYAHSFIHSEWVMSFTSGLRSYSLHYLPVSKTQQHHLLLWDSNTVSENQEVQAAERLCVLFLKRHTFISCCYSVVLHCVAICLVCAVWRCAMSCLWQPLLCLPQSCRWNNCIQIEEVQRVVVIPLSLLIFFFCCFVRHTIYLGKNMTSSSAKLEIKQVSTHFWKYWLLPFRLV